MELDKEIDKYLDRKEDKVKERTYFYISEVGKSKKEIYEAFKNPKPRKIEARVRRILENGDYMHHRYYKYLTEMGMLIAAELTAVENDLVHGRADAVISDKKDLYVLDLKSCSMWVFNKLNEAQHEHQLQLQFYMYFLNISKGIILYENKDNQAMKVFNYNLDKELVEKNIKELEKLKRDILNNVPPIEIETKMEDLSYVG